jgi:hypothetical protein
MARFEWARDHPDDFSLGGDVFDMLRERVAYRRGCCRHAYSVDRFSTIDFVAWCALRISAGRFAISPVSKCPRNPHLHGC